MNEIVFLRPWAFWFLIPSLLFCFRAFGTSEAWGRAVDSHLLPFLSRGRSGQKRILPILSFFASICAVLAMVGVGVQRTNGTLYAPKTPVMIMADLSLSMRAKDVFPNRFSALQFKSYDILNGLKGMPVGFGIFANEPYSLLPTTTDKSVIENILPLLNFDLVPAQGSRIDRALEEAVRMLKSTGAKGGDIFLLTDGGEEVLAQQDDALKTAASFAKSGGRLFVLGIGTTAGAPLMQKDDTPITDRLGNPVHHRLKEEFLKKLALKGNGAYASVSADGSDTAFLMRSYARLFQDADASEINVKNDPRTTDIGWMFLFPALLVFPFLAGRGALSVLLIFGFFSVPANASDLFLNAPARAEKALKSGDVSKALRIARDAEDFKTYYNTGTRLIRMENYDAAVEMLKAAVFENPNSEDAQINLEIAERLRNREPPPDGGQGKNDDSNGDGDSSGNNEGNSDNGTGGSGGPSAGGGNGEGDSENQENNLNQNNKNNKQHTDNKQNDNQNSLQENKVEASSGASGASDNGQGGNFENKPSNTPSEGQGQGGGAPKIPDDPSLLLKQKILFQHLSGRYPPESLQGAEW